MEDKKTPWFYIKTVIKTTKETEIGGKAFDGAKEVAKAIIDIFKK